MRSRLLRRRGKRRSGARVIESRRTARACANQPADDGADLPRESDAAQRGPRSTAASNSARVRGASPSSKQARRNASCSIASTSSLPAEVWSGAEQEPGIAPMALGEIARLAARASSAPDGRRRCRQDCAASAADHSKRTIAASRCRASVGNTCTAPSVEFEHGRCGQLVRLEAAPRRRGGQARARAIQLAARACSAAAPQIRHVRPRRELSSLPDHREPRHEMRRHLARIESHQRLPECARTSLSHSAS